MSLARRLMTEYTKHTVDKSGSGKTSRKKTSSKITEQQDSKAIDTSLINMDKISNDNAMTSVPDPVPDTGIRPAKLQPVSSTTTNPLLTGKDAISTTRLLTLGSATLTLLPSLPSMISSKSFLNKEFPTSLAIPSPTPTTDAVETTTDAPAQHQAPHSHSISTVAITLLAVGFALVLLGMFIVIRACSRPHRRMHPTPSLPIFKDDFPDEKPVDSDGSPLFGGKERLSPRPGSKTGMWVWPQYQPSNTVAKPAEIAAYGRLADGNLGHNYNHLSGSHGEQVKTPYLFLGHPHGYGVSMQTSGNPPYQAPLQQAQGVLTRAVSRLSTASLSLYPGSPLNDQDVGIAVDGVALGTSFTADGHPVIKRTKSKPTLQRQSHVVPHGGLDVSSPRIRVSQSISSIPIVPTASVNTGRSRVKSAYYAPGSYPRVPVAPLSTSVPSKAGHSSPFESQQPMPKSESRRDRDTQALTSALGLMTSDLSQPSSPQPTLYPDDSFSMVVVGRPNKRSNKKPAPSVVDDDAQGHSRFSMVSPRVDSSALGSLMLMDYGSTTKPLTPVDRRLGENIAQAQICSVSTSSLNGLAKATIVNPSLAKSPTALKILPRADDKPPRVPSPPPLPSLTQMGLAHANPEAYAEYRSPTYSIFGLYEGDRKSRVGSFGY